ncbi:hypothetical protein HHK36_020206 [Tetracentron sinense]|uniref:Uncharacterized protein n=1 Tax=Tetracentron sinense TaxID=13715 RepID=A0A834YR95_TETSI|nr:hypothetical protein HHK36_020206 [Tetracentron sinense]
MRMEDSLLHLIILPKPMRMENSRLLHLIIRLTSRNLESPTKVATYQLPIFKFFL